MNKIPCEKCAHYDVQKKFTPKGEKDAWLGWCIAKSVYPNPVPEGMTLPDGAKQVAPGTDRSKPYIVSGKSTQKTCSLVMLK